MPSASSCTTLPPRAMASALTAFSPGEIQGLTSTAPRSAFAPSFVTSPASLSSGVAVDILTLTRSGASNKNGLPTAVQSRGRQATASVLQQVLPSVAWPLPPAACCSSNALNTRLPFRGFAISSPVSTSQSSPPSLAKERKSQLSAPATPASVAAARSRRQCLKPMTFLKSPGLFSFIQRRLAFDKI